MKISKLTAGLALSVVTTLLMGLLMGTSGEIVVFLLMLALILLVGARFAISAHDDNERQSHTSLSHIVLENPKTESPDPNPEDMSDSRSFS
jgi:hypothetical protein